MKRRTLMDFVEDSGKAKVNMRLANRLSGGLDEESKATVSDLVERINNGGDSLFKELEDFCQQVVDKIADPDVKVDGEDVAWNLVIIDNHLIRIDTELSSLKSELDFVEMSLKDELNKFYAEQFDGTVNDRTAYAESKTVKERYTVFVKRAFYDALISRRDAITSLKKSLERWAWKNI